MVDKAIYNPGEAIRVIGVNFKPNTTVVLTTSPVWAGASPINITVRSDGYFATTLTLPANYNATSGILRARIDAQSETIKRFAVSQPVVRTAIKFISPRLTDAINGVYQTDRTLASFRIEWTDKLEVGSQSKMRGAKRYYRYQIGFKPTSSNQVSTLQTLAGYEKTGTTELFSDRISIAQLTALALPGSSLINASCVVIRTACQG